MGPIMTTRRNGPIVSMWLAEIIDDSLTQTSSRARRRHGYERTHHHDKKVAPRWRALSDHRSGSDHLSIRDFVSSHERARILLQRADPRVRSSRQECVLAVRGPCPNTEGRVMIVHIRRNRRRERRRSLSCRYSAGRSDLEIWSTSEGSAYGGGTSARPSYARASSRYEGNWGSLSESRRETVRRS